MSIAVLDIGKTNAKVVLVSPEGQELAERRMSNTVRHGPPYPHLDTEALWRFTTAALSDFAERVETIVPVTHGACAALVRADGALALPVLDYEYSAPNMHEGYVPPPFDETGSPPLPGGLNVGLQLHWLERTFPEDFAQVDRLLFWPQYWAWRLSGVMASERTSLGCHTDLWMPGRDAPSSLARDRGWDSLLPPLAEAETVLGPITKELAHTTGLSPKVEVLAGIHDSNASLLPWLDHAPCAVLSTGTWIIAMALGGTGGDLDPSLDMLLNVAADGRPVPTARFMGGRERDAALAGGVDPATADAEIARRAAARLARLGAVGPIYVEGPFSASAAFLDTLAKETGRPVKAAGSGAGTTRGAALLAAKQGRT